MPRNARIARIIPDNTGGEVVHQHLETGLNLTVYQPSKCLIAQPPSGPAIMARGTRHVRADDDAHCGDGTDDAATLTAN